MRFAYQSYPVVGIGTGTPRHVLVHRPMIPMIVLGPNGEDDLLGLADTGADDTVLPDYLVKTLGVALIPGQHAVILGINGGTSLDRYGMVDLAIPSPAGLYRWSARVGFHPSFHAVLGHSGFLEYFNATFNGRRRHLTLTPNGSAPAPALPKA